MAASHVEARDRAVEEINRALARYTSRYPDAQIVTRRYNPHSIRVRVVDPQYAGWDRARRHQFVWAFLEPLDEDVLSDISMLLLLAPEECASSLVNLEFEDPSPDLL